MFQIFRQLKIHLTLRNLFSGNGAFVRQSGKMW